MSTKPTLRAFIELPEINVAFFSFILHFLWEFLQAPAFAGMAEMSHGQGIVVCTEATIGDVGIALTAVGQRRELPDRVYGSWTRRSDLF